MEITWKRWITVILALLFALFVTALVLHFMPRDAHAAVNQTYIVHYTTDTGAGAGNIGDLRYCITQSNSNPPGPGDWNEIHFNTGASPNTINITGALLNITAPVRFIGNSHGEQWSINGAGAGAVDGLIITASGSGVTGLAIYSFNGNGIVLDGITDAIVDGNRLGTDWADTPAIGNTSYGVLVQNGATTNTIGGDTPQERNVISENGGGVGISGSNGNTVSGNYIGTDSTGTLHRPNWNWGVYVWSGASGNTIGGDTAEERNVISGNVNGIGIQDSDGNTVKGNYIGVDQSGDNPLGNSHNGVYLQNANTNTIGGPNPGEGNIISANGSVWPWRCGIELSGASGPNTDNTIQGNYIGTDAAGEHDLGNRAYGVWLNRNNHDNNIEGNLVSGNDNYGIWIYETPGLTTTGNTVKGNYIGTDSTGTAAIGNYQSGVQISGQPAAWSNTIGGDTPEERNVISGNNGFGVSLNADWNVVQGNYIGTDATGTLDLGNTSHGIYVAAQGIAIGGANPGEGNVISGNDENGIIIFSGSPYCTIRGNYIGTDADGDDDLGNTLSGVKLAGGWPGNNNIAIGGANPGEGNVISGNDEYGVQMVWGYSNTVQGNNIGTDTTGTADLGNTLSGVALISDNGISNVTIGGPNPGEGNLISGNDGHGVLVNGSPGGCANNTLKGNYIGIDVNGTAGLGNGDSGVHVEASTGTAVGGTEAGAGNLISDNGDNGVYVTTSTTSTIQGNYIGTDVNGAADLGNAASGVYLLSNAGVSTVGGTTVDERNLVSGNDGDGVKIESSTGQTVHGNYIGTGASGTADLGNNGSGVYLTASADNNPVGGFNPGEGNVISGNENHGVYIDSSTGNNVQGNYIGTDESGTADLGNNGSGVYFSSADNNTIGGSSAAENLIIHNGEHGVKVNPSSNCEVSYNKIWNNAGYGVGLWDSSLNNKISRNSIYDNGDLGVYLEGVTQGDFPDAGKPNYAMDYPVFSPSVVPVVNGQAEVSGTAVANSEVELFLSGPNPDPSGHGEGKIYLTTLTADGSGNFSTTLSGIPEGNAISATATDTDGLETDSTSMFSNLDTLFLEPIKAADCTQATPGGKITYTISLENKGTGQPTTVNFIDQIPEGTTEIKESVYCSDPGATIFGRDPVIITGITIPAGETVTIKFTVTIKENVEAGTVIGNQGVAEFLTTEFKTSDPDHPGEGRPTEVTVKVAEKVLGSMAWIVAEGSTGGGFDTFILIQNPNDEPAPTEVAFATENGIQDGTFLIIPPRSRLTLRLSDYMPDQWSVSTLVAAEVPIVVERSMYWNSNESIYPYEMMSGHANLGFPAPMSMDFEIASSSDISTDQYFPEGSTAGFDTWLLLFNPNGAQADAHVTLMDTTGPVVEKDVTIEALSRKTVHLNGLLPNANEVAIRVESESFLVAERSMYWDPAASAKQPYEMIGGHATSGSPTSATNWYIAEGSTGGGFETYILVLNPGDTEAPVILTFMDEEGVCNLAATLMPPQSRATFKISDYVPDNFQVSTSLTSDVPIVAERSMYWDKREASEPYAMKDGHSCMGETGAAATWMVPEGSTGGGFDTFILITNTEDTEANTNITFMTEDGPQTPFNITILPNSRFTLWVNDYLPAEFQVSTLINSDNQVVVERSMYWDNRQISPDGNFPVRPFECKGGNSANGLDP